MQGAATAMKTTHIAVYEPTRYTSTYTRITCDVLPKGKKARRGILVRKKQNNTGDTNSSSNSSSRPRILADRDPSTVSDLFAAGGGTATLLSGAVGCTERSLAGAEADVVRSKL